LGRPISFGETTSRKAGRSLRVGWQAHLLLCDVSTIRSTSAIDAEALATSLSIRITPRLSQCRVNIGALDDVGVGFAARQDRVHVGRQDEHVEQVQEVNPRLPRGQPVADVGFTIWMSGTPPNK
jgi:hypothetical protein